MTTDEEMENTGITDDEFDEDKEAQGPLDRIVNVFLDPAALFKQLAKKPEFWTPVILIILINVVLGITTYPATKEMRVEANRTIWVMRAEGDTEDEKQEAITEMEKDYIENKQKIEPYIQAATGIFGTFVGFLILSGLLYLISLIQGLDTKFPSMFSVVAYTALIGTLGQIVDKLIKIAGVVKAETIVEWALPVTGLSFYLPQGTHMSALFVSALLDPFTIWGLIVTVIGLGYANRCSRKAAIMTVIIYLIILIAFMVGSGFLQQMFLNKAAEAGGGGVAVQVG